jgi:transcriptional regulator of aromatic amino acid metabolism
VILSDGCQDDGAGVRVATECVIRSWRLRDRFSPGDFQVMIDLYRSGVTARRVAEKFGVSLSSVKRVLRQHGVDRKGRR